MGDRFDVVIVGARCAGSPLAIQLATSGLRVALVDRAPFPSNTPSTHLFEAEGIASFRRLGVLDRLVSTGAPFIERVHMRLEDVVADVAWPLRPADAGPAMSVRRTLLDAILVDAARDAGAEVRTSTKVTALLADDGRITGVRARSDGHDIELSAGLVVGADGRGSTVGDLAGSRLYNVTRSERFFCWAYYEGAARPRPEGMWFQRWGEELVIGFPCDSGLFLVAVAPPLGRLAELGADAERSFDAYVRQCEPLAAVVGAPGARRVGRLHRMTWAGGYFRESAGAGWVLVGDAGHFKDPAPAQGISDALRQVDRLAPAIVAGLGGARPLDDSLREWWRWRDRDAAEHYWFAADQGRAGLVPAVGVEVLRRALRREETASRLLELLNHRARPSELLSPGLVAGALWPLMKSGVPPRRRVLSELGRMGADELRRRRLNRHPAYADG